MNYHTPLVIIRFSLFFVLSLIPAFLLSLLINREKKENVLVSGFLLYPLMVFYSIFILSYTSFSANFATLFTLLLAVTFFLFLLLKNYGAVDFSATRFNFLLFDKKALAIFSPFAFLLLFRAVFQPTISPDSVFRWQHLAELIFKTGTLDFYPPSRVLDFIIYPYPDGFPPLVSAIYAFFYICAGEVSYALSVVSVLIQFFLCGYFVYNSAILCSDDRNSARISLIVLLSSPFFFFSLFLGQETGWTAVCASAFLFYSLRASKLKGRNSPDLILASCSLAIGGLSREYGMIFIALSPIILYFLGIEKKGIIITVLLAFFLTIPFYLRNIVLFSNPFYPLFFISALDYNTTHKGIMDVYASEFSALENPQFLVLALKLAFIGLPLQIFALVFSLKEKKFLPFNILSIVVIILWAFSTRYTCGEIFYSMRVLNPFIVCISIPAGIIFANFARKFKIYLRIIPYLILLYSFLSCLCIPLVFYRILPSEWFRVAFSTREGIERMIMKYTTPLPDNSLILSDSALYAAYLYRNGDGKKRLVPVWSPELYFLFNEKISFDDKVELLKKSGILYIMRTNQTANNLYFEKFSFFREYPQKAREIIRGSDSRIFSLENIGEQ